LGLHQAAGSIRSRHRLKKEALTRFAAAEGFQIVAEVTAIETGKGSDALERIRLRLLRLGGLYCEPDG
jgi:hypothetical protein